MTPPSDPIRRSVVTGLERLLEDSSILASRRIGILAHSASLTSHFELIVEALSRNRDVRIARLFVPEHGWDGALQDQVPNSDEATAPGPKIVSLYGNSFDSLWPSPEALADLDLLLIDLQDVGSRYYTFYTTAAFCLERAATLDLPVIILDRPNPIGGTAIEGTLLTPEMQSFVGWYPLPVRHGMTLGELLFMLNERLGIGANLRVIPMTGWSRTMRFDETGLPWVPPSPNMPTLDTALVYPGGCLIEGTNLSEGRGTTRPFEQFGAPFVDPLGLLRELKKDALPGCEFRAVHFQPTFHKWAGTLCHGLFVHVTDWRRFKPWLTYVLILKHLFKRHPEFDWRTEPYEFVSDRLAIDLLLGDPDIRIAIEEGADRAWFEEMEDRCRKEFSEARRPFLLYS